jgi:hypothetical protein
VAKGSETVTTSAPNLAVATAAPSKPATGRLITLYCSHELEEATLLLVSGGKTFYQGRLIGKRKRGFIGIGGKGFSGVFSAFVAIPAEAKELTVRVYSADGSVNVLNRIPASPPSENATTLRVTPAKDQLRVEWVTAHAPGK